MVLSEASIRRPVAMSALIIGLVLLGLQAYRKMAVEFLPSMDIPLLTIQTIYPGASPEQLETDVAKRIEDKMMALDGLDFVQSTCMENVCLTQIQFVTGVDIDLAAIDAREKLDMIAGDFPADVEDPVIQKFDINATAVVNLVLTGDAPREELFDFADNTLKDRITTIPGVAECSLIGGAEQEVQILLDRDRLAARGLSSTQVVSAIQNAVRKIPSGRVRGQGMEYSVEFDSEYKNVADINGLVLSASDGRRCYLRDVGRAEMRTEELRQKATYNGRPCISIEVVKREDANAVQVVERVREAMDRLRAELPGGMELAWVKDDGAFIQSSVRSAWLNVGQGILLTAAILFLFLYNIRSTIVIGITMPLTIVIGLFLLSFLGYTLNTSTLISIGLSVGILVTNSIVVMEAIVKHLENGASPRDAARKGAAESWIPVLASAGTNVVVLFPIAMISVTVGQFLRPLVVTMIVMTLVSLFVSFTLTPMLCMLLLRHRKPSKWNPVTYMERGWNYLFDKQTAAYGGFIRFLARWRLVAIPVVLAVGWLFMFSMGLGPKIGGSFFPDIDKGQITIRLEFPTSYSLAATEARVQEAEARLQDLPELRSVLTTVGKVQGMAGQASEGVYLGQIQLKFSERTERTLHLTELQDMTRKRLANFTDCVVGVFKPSAIGGIAPKMEYYLYGDDLVALEQLGTELKDWAESEGTFTEMDTTVRAGKPKIRVTPKRTELADLAIPAVGIGMTLRGNIEGLEAGTFTRGDRNYDIVVKFDEQAGRDQIEEFLLPSRPGESLSLGSVANVDETIMPIQILRRDKRRVCKISGNSRIAVGTASAKLAAKTKGILPPGYDAKFAGEVERMQETQAAMGEAALTAIVLVILTLAAVMESWRQPLLILLALPLALIGYMWALYTFGETFSLFVIMSAVMLIGIVVNNAILIMDQFNVHVAEGVPRHEAMAEAAIERFRPIVMITCAAVLGMLPMALGQGIGSELRTGVGIASAGGILASGVLTMIVIPVLYNLFTRDPTERSMFSHLRARLQRTPKPAVSAEEE
jgi:hydrophobic/amphiphilic exporter-1 (mainly G- bacteria), HAE1 family